jgi:hypothetical protein
VFAPSLLSVLLHEVWKGNPSPSHPPFELDLNSIVRQVKTLAPPKGSGVLVPIVVESTRFGAWSELAQLERAPDRDSQGGTLMWGDVPLGTLAQMLSTAGESDASVEYVDLGPPVEPCNLASSIEADLERRITQLFSTAPPRGPARVIVVLIDEGRYALGSKPNDFGGRVRHLLDADVEMGKHALEVLAVLLERLRDRGVLSEVDVVCSLVVPEAPVGARVFQHAGAPQLLAAIKRVDAELSVRAIPAVVNISMGAHAGPHNGESPLEEACRSMLLRRGGPLCFVHVAAGNHGASGVHARADLRPTQTKHIALRTGPRGISTILVESWWLEPPGSSDLRIEVDARKLGGAAIMPQLVLTPTLGQAVLTPDALGATDRRASLYSAAYRNGFSCSAFELSANDPFDLSSIEISFAFTSRSDLVVHSWIVVDKDRQSAFVTGSDSGGSLVIPATEPEVIAVAGATHARQPWRSTSTGPIAEYTPYPYPHPYWLHGHPPPPWFGFETQPSIAHLAAFESKPASSATSDWGTSYAAPRACADTVAVLLDPSQRVIDRDTLLAALLSGAPSRQPWDPTMGFGCVPL